MLVKSKFTIKSIHRNLLTSVRLKLMYPKDIKWILEVVNEKEIRISGVISNNKLLLWLCVCVCVHSHFKGRL